MTTAACSWPHCGQGAVPGDPFAGCTGVTVTVTGRCLAHANPDEQGAFLACLSPGADLDLRGTTIDGPLLAQVLAAITDPATGRPEIGTALFVSATFTADAVFAATFTGTANFMRVIFAGNAWFESAAFTNHAHFALATFTGDACFESATFTGQAGFHGTTFAETARFRSATFTEAAWFDSATFTREAVFTLATFTKAAVFTSATFTEAAWFSQVTFAGNVEFEPAIFAEGAWFNSVVFQRAVSLGPLVCAGGVVLSGAFFGAPVTVEIAARQVVMRGTRWSQPATVWLRYADADLGDAVLEYPVTVAARTRPFATSLASEVDESVLTGVPPRAGVVSLRRVDAGQLVLTDVDLTQCRFAGTVHLDQLRLEGDCRFPESPAGLHRRGWLPVRHTRRDTLAEEQHWRSTRPGAVSGWQTSPPDADVLQPRALAAVYRALRKAFEDSSNEPGSSDFYYGEMAMRRADLRTAKAERALLTAYWALSGYGLRALRAFGWLLLAVSITLLVMMLWGLPEHDTPSLSTGVLNGRRITITTDDPDPENPTGPPGERLTSARFEKSLRVVVNSVIFRSSGQDLTTTGTYTEMVSRLTEPVLLGLAVLAIRGRIKR